MKKIKYLVITGVMALCLCGCVEINEVEENVQTEIPTEIQEEKPLTKQVCDFFGINSGEIIEEQAQQGYVFTGRTRGFWCEDVLNFKLEDSE